jgi:hypothetical protein
MAARNRSGDPWCFAARGYGAGLGDAKSPEDLPGGIGREREQQAVGPGLSVGARLIRWIEVTGTALGAPLGDRDWLLVALVVPKSTNVLLLDETIMMPLLRSITVSGPLGGEAGPAATEPAPDQSDTTSTPAEVTPSRTPIS